DSVERIARTLPQGAPVELTYLAPPDELLELLEEVDAASTGSDAVDEDDEVDVDEDADQAIEADRKDRWIAFLAWIGVNKALRPVHFHDVEDDATGWLTTKKLTQPGGWAFKSLGEAWTSFEASLKQRLENREESSDFVPYLYEVHDLDQIV